MDDPEEKPLDQIVREAEQYAFDFEETPQQQPPIAEMQVCCGNCKICPYCDGE